jgi:hypothetical protein
MRRRENLGDLGLVGRIILEWILKKKCEGVGWINLDQDKLKRRALTITVINLWVP